MKRLNEIFRELPSERQEHIEKRVAELLQDPEIKASLHARPSTLGIYFYKFVKFKEAEDHLRLGWMVSIPNGPMHHHYYGIEMKWICSCPVR